MVTITSDAEHIAFNDFFRNLQYSTVWGGAQIVNKAPFTSWLITFGS